MSNFWTKKEESLLRQMTEAGKTIQEIYNSFLLLKGLDGFFCLRTEKAISNKSKAMNFSIANKSILDENFDRLKEITDRYSEESIELYPVTSGKDRFILSLSDIHLPFTPVERIRDILNQWKNELKNPNSILVLNGDIMDQYAASIFTKYKDIHLVYEYRAAFNLVKLCLDYVENIALTKGNHEVRLSRLANDRLPKEVNSLYQFDLLSRLSNGEIIDDYGAVVDLDKDMRKRLRYQFKEPWYCRIGKTIFAHPSGFASAAQSGSTVTKTNKIFDSRYTREDYDSLVIGHTHMQSKQIVDGRLLIEQGALCGLLGYEGKADLKFGFSTNGYATIWQDLKGNTNFNESTFHYLGRKFPKKKQLTWNKPL